VRILSRVGAAIFVVVLAAAPLAAEYAFVPQRHGDMEARLTVAVPSRSAERGLAELTMTLTVEGPPGLEVETPRLGDAAAAWKDQRAPIHREEGGEKATWSQVIRLKQIKPGFEPVVDVTVRFRRGPEADWIEAKWINILREVRETREPLPPEPAAQPAWWRRWGFVPLLAATALLILWAWWSKRRERREPLLPPDRWALREIDRLEQTLTPQGGDAETYHTRMSYIVRRYLTERFGLHALQQTTAEVLDIVRQELRFSAEQQTLLSEWFERCDLAKFARANSSPHECRRSAELAREVVRRTTEFNNRLMRDNPK
jgi:hypothetical protein